MRKPVPLCISRCLATRLTCTQIDMHAHTAFVSFIITNIFKKENDLITNAISVDSVQNIDTVDSVLNIHAVTKV